MPFFLFGIALVYAAAIGTVLYTDGAARSDNPWVLAVILRGVIVPVAAAWVIAEVFRAVRRPRALQPGMAWWVGGLVRGMMAGVIGIALSLAALVKLDGPPPDTALMGMSAAFGAFATLVFSRRARPGTCLSCGYDLSGLTAAAKGRCPECGADVIPSVQPARRAA